jgi:hypothetical protein
VVAGSVLFHNIRDDLVLYRRSPQQIAAKLRAMHPDDLAQRVSHETIYAAIYSHPRGGLKKELVEALRQCKPKRGMRRTTASYPELMKRLNIDLWFADPHAPWQRGSNENTNGLRQFMPKGADLSKASQEYLNNVADLMNARPWQTLGWKAPNEALEVEIAQFNSRVALASWDRPWGCSVIVMPSSYRSPCWDYITLQGIRFSGARSKRRFFAYLRGYSPSNAVALQGTCHRVGAAIVRLLPLLFPLRG